MTDTKIFVSKHGDSMSGVTASYGDNGNAAAFFKVTAVRTLSTQQDGTIVLLDNGITDIEYASEMTVNERIYQGIVSSITSSRSDRFYTLEVSNIFGNSGNPILVYDSSVSLKLTSQFPSVYDVNTRFSQSDVEANPLTFLIDKNTYSGPTNEIQLDFYRLLPDSNGVLNKHGDPISFVR